jgi:hypothetical protein
MNNDHAMVGIRGQEWLPDPYHVALRLLIEWHAHTVGGLLEEVDSSSWFASRGGINGGARIVFFEDSRRLKI